MISELRPAIVFTLLMTLLTGILYPSVITGVAEALFPKQAHGSLIEQKGSVIGSELIGQSFTSDKYFHGRPSATTMTDPNDSTKTLPSPYNAANSSGSNLGPTSQAFMDGIKAAAAALQPDNDAAIPVDLVTASGSGLDPDITPAAAQFQVNRVAKARSLTDAEVARLVADATKDRLLGFIGEPTVNVLKLNIALDRAHP